MYIMLKNGREIKLGKQIPSIILNQSNKLSSKQFFLSFRFLKFKVQKKFSNLPLSGKNPPDLLWPDSVWTRLTYGIFPGFGPGEPPVVRCCEIRVVFYCDFSFRTASIFSLSCDVLCMCCNRHGITVTQWLSIVHK